MIRASGVTEAGTVRDHNEDAFVNDVAARLFAVSDGMGGQNAGEVASRVAIDAMTEFINRSAADPDLTWPHGLDAGLSLDGNRLRTAVMLANRSVRRAAAAEPEYEGMGATVVGLMVDDRRLTVAHVGDSRLYLVSDGTIEQLTRDDSWVETLLDQNPALLPRDLANHPMRNVLTNVLGAREDVDVHMAERALRGGEIMLLCSDGVHGVLTPETLRDLLTRSADVELTARAVIAMAMERGSRDNVTAVVVRYEAA